MQLATPKQSATYEPPKPTSSSIDELAPVTPDKAHQDDVHKSVSVAPSTSVKALQDDVHESAPASSLLPLSDESMEWTQVSRKRRRPRLPPCWKLRFPAHLCDSLKTPSSFDSEDSDGSNTECASHSVRGSPTPVAARTRSRAKLKSYNYNHRVTGHALD